jgi:hypothetical protein
LIQFVKNLSTRIFRKKTFHRTSQRLSNSDKCGKKDVNFASFNSLNIANIQIGKFGEPLLAHFAGGALASYVVAQLFKPGRTGFGLWHVPFVLKFVIDSYGVYAVLLRRRMMRLESHFGIGSTTPSKAISFFWRELGLALAIGNFPLSK